MLDQAHDFCGGQRPLFRQLQKPKKYDMGPELARGCPHTGCVTRSGWVCYLTSQSLFPHLLQGHHKTCPTELFADTEQPCRLDRWRCKVTTTLLPGDLGMDPGKEAAATLAPDVSLPSLSNSPGSQARGQAHQVSRGRRLTEIG